MIDEAEFDAHFYGLFRHIASQSSDWVVHGPALFHHIFDVLHDFPDVTFVVVKRNMEDIYSSQKRIEWGEEIERMHMSVQPYDTRPISEIKYGAWDKWKTHLPSWVEYQYEDFELHPLWVPKEKRARFHSKQWKVEEE